MTCRKHLVVKRPLDSFLLPCLSVVCVLSKFAKRGVQYNEFGRKVIARKAFVLDRFWSLQNQVYLYITCQDRDQFSTLSKYRIKLRFRG